MAARAGSLSNSRLRRLAQRGPAVAAAEEQEERCELCGVPISPDHRHMLDLSSRELMCACRACSTLFDRAAAGGGHFRLIGDRRLSLPDFRLGDQVWAQLRIPVEMAFFFHNSGEERVMAFYPSPMGPTESQLELTAWEQIEAANPVLETMEPDVEALLVDRSREEHRYWLVPIDECYSLVGLIRTRWKGLSGGREVWTEIAAFFEDLDRRSKTAGDERVRNPSTAAAAAMEGSSDG